MGLEFHCVDAFSDAPYQGAPILVFPRAEGLVDAQMRRIAREFGYEDTVFLQRDGASLHWQMHLFGRRGNLQPFAGHPTVAAGAVLIQAGVLPATEGTSTFSFGLPIGTVDLQVRCADGRPMHSAFRMQCNHAVDAYVPGAADIAAVLGLPDADLIGMTGHAPLSLLGGPLSYFVVPLRDSATLQQACFDRTAWARSSATVTLPPQILAIAPAGMEADGTPRIEARLFGLDIAPQDDPPIGSAMPALASYLALSEPADPLRIVALRGMGHGRLSTLQVIAQRSGQTVMEVSVGGAVTPIAQGQLITD
ncbi:MAG: PhzF family phenazine biosynthesis isomerase [Pseudomonadota bacterium]